MILAAYRLLQEELQCIVLQLLCIHSPEPLFPTCLLEREGGGVWGDGGKGDSMCSDFAHH